MRQTVLLQGKVPGDWCGRFRGRLFLTSRSFRFLARLKAFSGGLLKILLVLLSSRRIRKFLEIIFSTTRLLGWKVVTKVTLSLPILLAASTKSRAEILKSDAANKIAKDRVPCPHVYSSSTITTPKGHVYITGHFSCITEHVVYYLSCTKCPSIFA